MTVMFWILLAIGLAVVEIVTATFFPIFFAASALVAIGLELADAPEWSQWLAFTLGGVVFSGLLRPLAKRQLESGPVLKSGVEQLAGRQAVVTSQIDGRAGTGAVTVDGQSWTARPAGDPLAVSIPAGADVEILEVQGAVLLVAPLDSTEVTA